MQVKDLNNIFKNSGPFWQEGHGVCSQWRNYPSITAVYILAEDITFKWGDKETDIIYIGSTKHLGGIESNCRLWDYHTRATQHEREIVEHVRALDAKAGEPVKIYWTHKFPHNYSHRQYEKQLLRRFAEDHGGPPRLNKSI
jgi:hypothetical protein